jgi:hypothetical protein
VERDITQKRSKIKGRREEKKRNVNVSIVSLILFNSFAQIMY